MKLEISKAQVWVTTIADQPGGLAGKLAPLADAGLDLEFVIARRDEASPGAGVLFVTPIKGAKRQAAAKQAGFHPSESIHALRIEASNEQGMGAKISQALADAGINLRGFSGAAIGRRAVLNLAFDSDDEAAKARRVLGKLR
jgi:hypothetical protein